MNGSLDAAESVYARSWWQINAKRARASENGDREVYTRIDLEGGVAVGGEMRWSDRQKGR